MHIHTIYLYEYIHARVTQRLTIREKLQLVFDIFKPDAYPYTIFI